MSIWPNRSLSDDRAYHLRRLGEERLRAEQAPSEAARRAHAAMAEAYARLAGEVPPDGILK